MASLLQVAVSVACLTAEPADGTRVFMGDLKAAIRLQRDGAVVTLDGEACRFDPQDFTRRGVEHFTPATGVVVYVNGIKTTPEKHCETLRAIRELTGRPVLGVYNATEGMRGDLSQSLVDHMWARRRHRNAATETLRSIVEAQTASGRRLEIWGHSQGGAIVASALRQIEAEHGARALETITVQSFGSAARWWPKGPDYTHYIRSEDPVSWYLGIGLAPYVTRRTTGADARIIRLRTPGAPWKSLRTHPVESYFDAFLRPCLPL